MSMRKMLFTAHWTPSEVDHLLDFLAGLQEMIKANYAEELEGYYQQLSQCADNNHHGQCDFINDDIPF